MAKKATDYKPDPKNANKGTERGLYMLEQSVSETGLGRSIVVDKNGVVIAGNKTLQAAIDAGLVEVKEVETDGNQLVVVRRTDLDLSEDERARKLAYFDNRAGEVGLEWDSAQLLADLEAGFDLSGMFREDELERPTINFEMDDGGLFDTFAEGVAFQNGGETFSITFVLKDELAQLAREVIAGGGKNRLQTQVEELLRDF